MTIAELFVKLGLKPDKKSFDAAERLITGVKVAVTALLSIKSVMWLNDLVQQTVELGGKLMDLSQVAGVPVETLQELGFAAQQNGESLEGMVSVLGKLSKNLVAATSGGKEQAKAFAKIGVATKNADGSIRATEDVMEDIADHFKSMPDGAEKVALSMELMGRSGASMIPTLNGGAEGLRAMREEARELGGIITEENVKALDDLGDEQDKLKFALSGLRNEIAVQLLPAFKEAVADILLWVKANKKLLAQKIAMVIKGIIAVVRVLAKVVGFISDIFLFLANNLTIVKVALLALGAAMVIYKAASIAAAIASAAAWMLSMLPFVLLGAVIAAVILIIQDLYSWANGGDSVFKDLWEAAKKSTNGVVQGFVAVVEGIRDAILAVKDFINSLIDLGKTIGSDDNLSKAFFGLAGEHVMSKVRDANDKEAHKDFQDAANAESERQFQLDVIRSRVTAANQAIAPPNPTVVSKKGDVNNNTTVHMQVNSTKADPKEVANEVNKSFKDLMDVMLRQTAHSVGGD